MNKKYFAVFLLFIFVLSVFAACIKANPGIIITGSDGKTRVLATNDNGETMTDSAGNIIIVMTDAKGKAARDKNGDQVTQKVSPPDYYIYNKVIEGPKFSVAIPEGWEQSDASNIRLKKTSTNAELNLMVEDGQTLAQVKDAVEEFMDKAAAEDPDAVFKVETIKLCGVSATMYLYDSEKYTARMVFYVLEKNGTDFLFQGAVGNEYKESVDFESVINTIKFK